MLALVAPSHPLDVSRCRPKSQDEEQRGIEKCSKTISLLGIRRTNALIFFKTEMLSWPSRLCLSLLCRNVPLEALVIKEPRQSLRKPSFGRRQHVRSAKVYVYSTLGNTCPDISRRQGNTSRIRVVIRSGLPQLFEEESDLNLPHNTPCILCTEDG